MSTTILRSAKRFNTEIAPLTGELVRFASAVRVQMSGGTGAGLMRAFRECEAAAAHIDPDVLLACAWIALLGRSLGKPVVVTSVTTKTVVGVEDSFTRVERS